MLIGIDASRSSGDLLTGTERYSREIVSAMLKVAPQHRFRLYTRAPCDSLAPHASPVAGEETRVEGGNVEVVCIRRARLWTHLGLAYEIAARPPDVLFIPAHVLPLSQIIRRTTRTVVTIHDVGYRHFPSAHPWRRRLYLDWSTALNARVASAVVVDSQATRADVQRFYKTSPAKLHVAYPGLLALPEVTKRETLEVLARYHLRTEQPYVLYVGTLQPRKNLRRLLQAWDILLKKDGPAEVAQLVLAGAAGWGGEDLPGIAVELGIAERVRFTGYIGDAEKSVLMRKARAFAFPSLYEGFGLPVLEAQSVGVPVVCSNTSSLPEVAGDAALQVNPLDPAAIAAALYQACYDEGMRTRLISAGALNTARFSWDRCARIVLNLIENRCQENRAAQ